MPIKLTSPVFEDGDLIPDRHTCDDADLSPPLAWTGIPAGTKSLAIFLEDPDVPDGPIAHWMLYGLPPETSELVEWVPTQPELVIGARQGMNDFGSIGYSGPCEQNATHRYVFTLYALDTPVDLPPGASRAELKSAMDAHILDAGELSCRYATNV